MFLKLLVANWGGKIATLKLPLAALDLEVMVYVPTGVYPSIMLLNLLLWEELIRGELLIIFHCMKRHLYIQLRQCLSQSCRHHLPDLLWKGIWVIQRQVLLHFMLLSELTWKLGMNQSQIILGYKFWRNMLVTSVFLLPCQFLYVSKHALGGS